MQLSNKQKTLSDIFFFVFWECRLNIKYFGKKDEPHTLRILEITDSKDVARQMSEKSRFRRPFNKRHGKRSQILFKFEGQHLYHNY